MTYQLIFPYFFDSSQGTIIWNIYIWVNYNISLTWIKAIWGWFPLLTMVPVRSQWGRYNLPRYMFNRPLKFLWSPCRATIHLSLSPYKKGTPDFHALAIFGHSFTISGHFRKQSHLISYQYCIWLVINIPSYHIHIKLVWIIPLHHVMPNF